MTETTTLIAAVRNEGPFLLEWIAYHRVIGFDTIVVYADQTTDGTGALLAALDAGSAVIHVPNAGRGGHRNRAYAAAQALPQVRDADWVMALDTDEFLNIHAGDGHVSDLLAQMPDADAISLTWLLFGHAGQTLFTDAPVLTRFTRAAPPDRAVSARQFGLKTLFRPALARAIAPHRPVVRAGRTVDNTLWLNGAGDDVTADLLHGGWRAAAETAAYDHAQINHYVVRSTEVFALHNLRTPALGSEPGPLTLNDFDDLNTNQTTDRSIQRHAEAVAAEIARLYALPDVAQAQAACVQITTAQIATLRAAHAADPNHPVTRLCDPATAHQQLRETAGRATPPAPASVPPTPPDADPETIASNDAAPRWLADLRRSNHPRGWYHSHRDFAVQFTARSHEVLVVSFDNLSSVNDPSLARDTWGYGFYAAEGWSHVGVMAFEKNWFRDTALFDIMEGLRHLFAQYRTVVMTGTSMGAYAATAFADLAPGCTVLAFSPQATLDRACVPWEDRFGSGRKRDWSGRYANAPDHCTRARDVFVVYDPYFEPDRLHAELYQGNNIHHLKSWYASHKSAQFMRRANILKTVMQEAVAGTLSPARYYALFRSRRDLVWYYMGLADHLLARGHRGLAAQLADHLVTLNRVGLARSIRTRL